MSIQRESIIALFKNKKLRRLIKKEPEMWVKPGMSVTFRAEVMPGHTASERTFRVTQVMTGGRIKLEGLMGEHKEQEFELVLYGT